MESKETEDRSERKSIVYLQAQFSVVMISKMFKKNVSKKVATKNENLKRICTAKVVSSFFLDREVQPKGCVEFLSICLLRKYWKTSLKLCQIKENYKVMSMHLVRHSVLTRGIFKDLMLGNYISLLTSFTGRRSPWNLLFPRQEWGLILIHIIALLPGSEVTGRISLSQETD